MVSARQNVIARWAKSRQTPWPETKTSAAVVQGSRRPIATRGGCGRSRRSPARATSRGRASRSAARPRGRARRQAEAAGHREGDRLVGQLGDRRLLGVQVEDVGGMRELELRLVRDPAAARRDREAIAGARRGAARRGPAPRGAARLAAGPAMRLRAPRGGPAPSRPPPRDSSAARSSRARSAARPTPARRR